MAVSNKYLETIHKIKENTYIKSYQVKSPNMETMHSRKKIALTSQKKIENKTHGSPACYHNQQRVNCGTHG